MDVAPGSMSACLVNVSIVSPPWSDCMNSAAEAALREMEVANPSEYAGAQQAAGAAALPIPSASRVFPWRLPTPRRMLNVGLALVSLIVLAPVMLLIALLVKLSSPGPVLYTQPRV